MPNDPFDRFNLPAEPPEFGTPAHQMVRRTDITTSREAAQSVNATKLEQEVYDCVKSFGVGGCTAEQVTIATGIPHETTSPRFRPLLDKGLIVDTGERRKASTGRRQRVVVADVFADEVIIVPIEKKVKRCPHCQGEL